jgi:hypothetical protein
MKAIWDLLAYVQNFFQLNFLFSGLEVSSSAIFAARVCVLLVFGFGLLWCSFRLLMKVLDCLQTLMASVAPIPRVFYLLLFLVIPLSPDSVGARWIGYILLVLCLAGLGTLAVTILVLWKYGVEQTLRLFNTLRSRSAEPRSEGRAAPIHSESVLRPIVDSPVVRTEHDSAR